MLHKDICEPSFIKLSVIKDVPAMTVPFSLHDDPYHAVSYTETAAAQNWTNPTRAEAVDGSAKKLVIEFAKARVIKK